MTRAQLSIRALLAFSVALGCGRTRSTGAETVRDAPEGSAGEPARAGNTGTTASGAAGTPGTGGSAPAAGNRGEAGNPDGTSGDPSGGTASDPPDVIASDPSTVHGTLLSPFGDPVAGARVRVGLQELITDGAGKFSLTGVADHYDLVATDGATRVLAYLGLKTRTPIVRGWDSSMRRSTTIKGTFSGGFGTPWSPSTVTGLWRNGAILEFLGPPDEKTASYGPVTVQWQSDVNPIDLKYLTLQYQTSGGSISGWAAALNDVTMTEGETITQDVTLNTLSTHQVKCSVNRPADVTLKSIGPYVMGFGADNASLATPLEVVLPVGLSKYGAGVTAQGSYADGVSVTTVLVPDERNDASLALTVPPSIVAPAANATRVNTATSFEWSDYAEGVQQLRILANVGGLELEVFTDASTFKLSDLALADFGFKSGAVYGWYTFGIGPVTSVDELVTGTSVLDAKGASYHAFYPVRYFTAE